jgi:hypothetical protein
VQNIFLYHICEDENFVKQFSQRNKRAIFFGDLGIHRRITEKSRKIICEGSG